MCKITLPPDDQTPSSASPAKVAQSDLGPISDQYIIVFKERWNGVINQTVSQDVLEFINSRVSEFGIADSLVKSRYENVLRGFTAKLTDNQLKTIKSDPRVDNVEQDRRFKAISGISSSTSSTRRNVSTIMAQTTPWGVNRVDGPINAGNKTAYVLDTGVDLNHTDLNVDASNSISFVDGEDADDYNGHGTHVAGILAAKDNSSAVVGVAAGATVVSVKVLDQSGNGSTSDIIDGINHVAAKSPYNSIVNMSLWSPGGINTSIDDAVEDAAAGTDGMRFVLIAGNAAGDANNYSPGRVESANVWTVSASDINDNFATSFSNYGNPPIEFAAPGANILSLWKNNNTNTKSGTSMAAPHVAGLLLATPEGTGSNDVVSGDPDGHPDPIVEAILSGEITGPSTRSSGQQGTWTVNPINEGSTVNYQWYYKVDHNDSWHAVSGNNSDTFSKTFFNTSSSVNQAGVRVNISSDGESATVTKNVSVTPSGDDCEDKIIC